MAEVAWLGKACLVGGVPARPVVAEEPWGETAVAWAALAAHPAILDVVAVENGQPCVAYRELSTVSAADERHLASWLVAVCEAVQHARHHGAAPRWFARPVLGIDANGYPRVGFLPSSGADPGPRVLIARIVELVVAGAPTSGALLNIVRDARQGKLGSFAAVMRRLVRCELARPRSREQAKAWDDYQRALGFAAVSGGAPPERPFEPRDPLELEAARRFAEARDAYARGTTVDDRLGLARCQLALGQLDDAIATVRAVDLPAAAWIEASARARNGDPAGALACASRLPDDDAAVWYLRGKALLGLRRHADARAALDRACALAPGHTAAQILRVEVIRAAARLSRELGRDPPAPAPTGPHADAVARVLAGDVDGAIALLRGRDDRDARLMLASCLAFRGRDADALLLYESLDGRAALLGRADCLLAVGRAEAALAGYDAVLAGDAYDVDALDGRARALDRLGRADAEAAHRRATAIALSHT